MQINISSRQLRAFELLAAERNFTRAAAASHLSQPAFSALVHQLEQTVGVRLFERSTRHVALSSEGLAFQPAARRVLAELDAALALMREHAACECGRVSIALLPSLAADWLPQVLAGFCSAHPGIKVTVSDQQSEPCIEQVRSGKADFALAATRAHGAELRAQAFCSDDFHLVCPSDHALPRGAVCGHVTCRRGRSSICRAPPACASASKPPPTPTPCPRCWNWTNWPRWRAWCALAWASAWCRPWRCSPFAARAC